MSPPARGTLAEYRRKRDFAKTPEPQGRAAGESDRFVVQKHAARRLHYDFRLALDGALKSWAVPKGPSLDPDEVRLAIEVEDHPLDYADFEGVIPPGEYGGGTVAVWDRGRWRPRGDPHRGLARGKLEFDLEGERLGGGWLLVRSRRRQGAKPNWLLRKLDDEFAGDDGALDELPASVASGRSIDEIAARPERVWRSEDGGPTAADLTGARRARLPAHLEPELATLVRAAPRGAEWLHEIKLDGYRILARVERGRVRLDSRQGKDWTASFAVVAEELARLPVRSALLDGEMVWLRPDGSADFQALQRAVQGAARDAPLHYYAFDLVHWDGWDLRDVPLEERKRALERLLEAAPRGVRRLRFSDHVRGQGEEFFRRACRAKLEGVVAKRADSPYRSGRGRDWVKVKCTGRQEFVVVGWLPSDSPRRTGFRSLLVATRDERGLVYAGKVGTGFDETTLASLGRRLRRLERRRSPLAAGAERAERGARWVAPELVAEIEFTEWTRDGSLRHPSFHGLREDKPAAEVVRERPAPAPPAHGAAEPAGRRKLGGVRLTHPERVLYPEPGITKRELARYYERVAEAMLPHVARRPLTLLRCPEGVGGECFYQKKRGDGMPDAILGVEVEEKAGQRATYVMIDSAEGLVALAQLGVLEIHPWGSRAGRLDRPDRLIFDLDPGPGVELAELVDAARQLRALLDSLGLESFLKLTGGKGLHLVVPIVPEIEWREAKSLTAAIARLLAAEPETRNRYTTNMSKRRREGRIFVDTLRNSHGNTAVAPYSTRARPRAPVATPVRWDELAPSLAPDAYHLRNVPRRLAALGAEPWAALDGAARRLAPAIRRRLLAGDPKRR